MNDLSLHPVTKRNIEQFLASPTQVLLVSGPVGSGKLTLAKRLVESVLELPENGFDNHGQALLITSEDGKAIGIDSARQLERFMRLKVPSQKTFNRAAVIENAHLLSPEAQNALLKTLEEPPSGSLIIMTVSHEPALLPTVRSRAQSLAVQRPEKKSLDEYFSQLGFSEVEINSAYALSGGAPGLMNALLQDEEHPLKLATEQARQLLSQPLYERLITADVLSKDRSLAIDTMAVLQRMARISLQKSAGKSATKWQKVLEASYQASEALNASAQPKLALTDLALQF